MTSCDDLLWIQALQAKNLNWLVPRLNLWLLPRLVFLAPLYGLPRDLVDDVYQQVLLKLHCKGTHYNSSFARPRAWILRLAIHTLIDAVRSEQRHQRGRLLSVCSSSAELTETIDPIDDRQPIPWDRTDLLIDKALASVRNAKHRAVIRDRLERLPQKQVAVKHNIPGNTVGVIFKRFKEVVRRLLEQEAMGHLG
ncbi:MAG: sigma-70 family RNA polymerase sigma factor [Gemmataceae bacterium]